MGFAGQATIQPAQLIIPVQEVIQPIAWQVFDGIPPAAEALLSMQRNQNFGTPVTANTFTVPDQMELRIGSVIITSRESSVAATDTLLVFRIRAGTLITGNEIVAWSVRTLTAAGPANLPISLPQPLVIPQNQAICFTWVSPGATIRADISMLGRLVQL